MFVRRYLIVGIVGILTSLLGMLFWLVFYDDVINIILKVDTDNVTMKRGAMDYDAAMCNVTCTTGIPCEYLDELDFRIIVFTYNRPDSLKKCLSSVSNLETLGDNVGVDIWIDRAKTGQVNQKTLDVAKGFQRTWSKGRVCVHVQKRNAYVIGQWVDTWRPRNNSREIALLLEDDTDISPMTYRWLKLMDYRFRFVPDVAGYALQAEVSFVHKDNKRRVNTIPKSHNVYLYRLFGTWGYSPKPNEWRNFQDWFHVVRKNTSFHPYISDLIITDWFRMFERRRNADSMWEMWVIYYHYINNLYTVYPNLQNYSGQSNTLLDINREEPGLHFKKKVKKDRSKLLLSTWQKNFEKFPDFFPRYDFDGKAYNVTVKV